jgi:hypothetical protein
MRNPGFRTAAIGAGAVVRLPASRNVAGPAADAAARFRLQPFVGRVMLIALNGGDLVTKPLIKPAFDRYGYRQTTIAGSLTGLAALAFIALARPGAMLAPLLLAALTVCGIARSLTFTAMTSLSFSSLTASTMTSGNIIASISMQIFNALGVSITAVILSLLAKLGGRAEPAMIDYRHAMLVIVLIGLAATIRLRNEIPEDLAPAGPGMREDRRKRENEREETSIDRDRCPLPRLAAVVRAGGNAPVPDGSLRRAQGGTYPDLGQFDNAYQEQCVARFPDRLAHVGAVQVAGRRGPKGHRPYPAGHGRAPAPPGCPKPGDDPLAIWRAAADGGLAISCGGPAASIISGEFAAIVREFAAMPFVIEHLGGWTRPDCDHSPQVWQGILALADYPNVILKIPALGQLAPRAVGQPLPAHAGARCGQGRDPDRSARRVRGGKADVGQRFPGRGLARGLCQRAGLDPHAVRGAQFRRT